PRRIGDRTQQELRSWASSLEVPVYTALQLLADPEADGNRAIGQSGREPEGRTDLVLSSVRPISSHAAASPSPSTERGIEEARFDREPAVRSPFAASAKTALLGFLSLLNELIAEAPVLTVSRLLTLVVEKTKYRDYLIDAFPADGEERWENV